MKVMDHWKNQAKIFIRGQNYLLRLPNYVKTYLSSESFNTEKDGRKKKTTRSKLDGLSYIDDGCPSGRSERPVMEKICCMWLLRVNSDLISQSSINQSIIAILNVCITSNDKNNPIIWFGFHLRLYVIKLVTVFFLAMGYSMVCCMMPTNFGIFTTQK